MPSIWPLINRFSFPSPSTEKIWNLTLEEPALTTRMSGCLPWDSLISSNRRWRSPSLATSHWWDEMFLLSGFEVLSSVVSSERLVLLVLYVRAREAPLARRSRAQAAPMLQYCYRCLVVSVFRMFGNCLLACRVVLTLLMRRL